MPVASRSEIRKQRAWVVLGLAMGLLVAFLVAKMVVGTIDAEFASIGFTDEELSHIETTCDERAAQRDGERTYEDAYDRCESELRSRINPDALPPD